MGRISLGSVAVLGLKLWVEPPSARQGPGPGGVAGDGPV